VTRVPKGTVGLAGGTFYFGRALTDEERIHHAEMRITARGYAIRYVDYGEDAETPGLLGQIRGAVNHDRREVKIARKANPTKAFLADALEHELRHIVEPDWDCGSRDVLGRGGERSRRAHDQAHGPSDSAA
jgi:hypothetical protein